MRWSSPCVKWSIACVTGIVAVAGSVRGEETIRIFSLDAEASCRDVNGRIVPPRIAPTLPTEAEKAFDMIRVKGGIEGRECFFYTFEVGLAPPKRPGSTSCPEASLGMEQSANAAGTRNAPEGCSK
jgi:hypothetical protein